MLKYKDALAVFEKKHGELLVADLADTDVYKLYHSTNANPTSVDYHKLVDALDTAYNNFTSRIKEFYPDIRSNDMWICCMVKAGLTSKEICNISSYSYSSIGMAKVRLYGKMLGKKVLQGILMHLYVNSKLFIIFLLTERYGGVC